MPAFEIPYGAADAKTWYLDGLAEGRMSFDLRIEAVTFAMASVQGLAAAGEDARMRIEGADGVWRVFDADLLPAC